MTRSAPHLLLLAALAASAARAAPAHGFEEAMADYNEGRYQRAAIGFHRAEARGRDEQQRSRAQLLLAQSLARLGFDFAAFSYYGEMVKAGPSRPDYLPAVEGAVAAMERLRDEVLGPNLLAKSWNDRFARLPPEVLAKVDYAVALLDYRAGKHDDAERLLRGVPERSAVYPQARYLSGLLFERKDPEQALAAFRAVLALGGAPSDLKELAHLALGRTLYGLRRYREASASYAALPRFSRHWDEALFEGAYADLQNDDPGAALGKLHSLHSPHLSDEFAPESLNLTAIIYHQRCLYPQAREVIAQFDRTYAPMKAKVKTILDSSLPAQAYWHMLQPGDERLPAAVKRHLQKNERVEAMVAYLGRLEAERAALQRAPELSQSALGVELEDLLASQQAMTAQIAGTFIKGRLADLQHLIELLDGDKEIIAFETTKGEKEMLEARFDIGAQLAAQSLERPAMPPAGHEYWPFDGEYWPDEIGYYHYTLKDGCPAKKEER